MNKANTFFETIDFYMKAGYSLQAALEEMSLQKRHDWVKRIYLIVLSGGGFAEACRTYIRLPRFAYDYIDIGEKQGVLHEAIAAVTTYVEEAAAVRNKLYMALLYPCILGAISIGLAAGLLYGIFPNILPIFDQFDAKLPLITRMMIFVHANAFSLILFLIPILGAGVILSGLLWWKSLTCRYYGGKLLLSLPGIGFMIRIRFIQSYFFIIHIIMSKNGTLFDALSYMQYPLFEVFVRMQHTIREEVEKGMPFSDSLGRYEHIFSKEIVDFIRLAERTKALSSISLIISMKYKKKIEVTLTLVQKLIEPVLITIISLCIGCMAIAMLLPLYQITQHMHAR